MRGARGVGLRARKASAVNDRSARRRLTQAELDVARSDPRHDEETAEEDHDEVLDGFEEDRRRKDLADEASDPAFGDGGAEIERSRLRELEAREAVWRRRVSGYISRGAC